MTALLANRNWEQHPPDHFPPGDAVAWGYDFYGLWKTVEIFGVQQTLRWVPRGEFLMGSPADEPERYENELQHPVRLTYGFWLADTACSQSLWEAVVGKNPADFKDSDNPVENVSWEDVSDFLAKLNTTQSDSKYSLPTEAQWEYACRAGSSTPFNSGENINPEQVNYHGAYPYNNGEKGAYRRKTIAVKTFVPNDWGLYQMHGNVLEWCSDWFGNYSSYQMTDPEGPADGATRVLRGGSWFIGARRCRSAFRGRREPADRGDNIGFRFAQAGNERSESQ